MKVFMEGLDSTKIEQTFYDMDTSVMKAVKVFVQTNIRILNA